MHMGGKRRQIPSTEEPRDIPAHWVRIANLYGTKTHRYNVVYTAINNGEITSAECIKLRLAPHDPRGPIYVDPAAAERVLRVDADAAERRVERTANVHRATATADAVHVKHVVESLASIDTTLDEIYRALERLTTAVESIATQPKTTHDHDLATVAGGNGFHN